jgi:hypothetical protein
MTLSAGRHLVHVEDLKLRVGGTEGAHYQSPTLPPSQSDRFRVGVSELQLVEEPAYLQVISSGATSAQIVVGRLLTEGESMFVDGMEMAVAMIYMVPTPVDDYPKEAPPFGLKFITIRTPLPKVPVTLEALTIQKCVVDPCPDLIPMLPPFNMEHDMIDDINIPDKVIGYPNCESLPDVQNPDNHIGEPDLVCNITGLLGPDGYGDISGLSMDYNTIAKRRVQDVSPIEECWLKETKEPRFDTNLLEEKFYQEIIWGGGSALSSGPYDELWFWKNIETLPWDYTEFILPELPEATGLEDMGYIGDYILVSSFWTQDWFTETYWGPPMPDQGNHIAQVRVKFDYDAAFSDASVTEYVPGDPPYPEPKSGLYVNTIGYTAPEPGPDEPCDYDDPANGGNGNGVIDKAEAINAIVDYFGGTIDKALAIDTIIYYFGQTQC